MGLTILVLISYLIVYFFYILMRNEKGIYTFGHAKAYAEGGYNNGHISAYNQVPFYLFDG